MKPVRIGTLVLVVMAVAVALPAAAGAEPAPTIEDVKKAWKARQDANKSFRVEWVETVKVMAGSYDSSGDSKNPGPHPPQDVEQKTVHSFAADGDKLAAAGEQAAYFAAEKRFLPYAHSEHFDGTASMRVSSMSQPGWTRVNIERGKMINVRATSNDAMKWLYRPLGGGAFSAFDFDQFKLFTGAKIGGILCVELRKTTGDFRYSIWCDPNREFLPIRHSWQYEGGEGNTLDWTYRKDGKGRWALSGWESKRTDKTGAVKWVAKAEVKKLELDHKFAADAFSPKPPPGSQVSVYEEDELKEEYLVRPDGSKRELKRAERNKSFDELSKTNADGTPYVPAKK